MDAGVKGSRRRAANISAASILLDDGRPCQSGSNGAVLERGRVVVEFDQRWKGSADRPYQLPDLLEARRQKIKGNTAWHNAVHHQPMPETGLRGAQDALAQHATMGEHESKPGIVADGADIAEVVGEALELRHQSAQPNCARRNFDTECDFNGTGKAKP